MATTLTAVLTHRERFVLAHVGDSRAYLLRDGILTQVTRDHSFVQSLGDAGRLRPEAAARHPGRSVVLRSVDALAEPEPDLVGLDLRLDDRLLICSDGLMTWCRPRPSPRCSPPPIRTPRLTRSSSLRLRPAGGRDHVTCLVADVVDGPALNHDGRLLGAMGDPYLVVDPAAVRSA